MTTPDPAERNLDQTSVLLARLNKGDRQALDELLVRDLEWVRERVHFQLGGSVRNEGETNDYVHDVVVNLLARGVRYAPADREQFRAFLVTSAVNHLRSVGRKLRTAKRDDQRRTPLPTDTALEAGGARPIDSVSRADAIAGRNEESSLVAHAMGTLDPVDQQILRMHSEDRTFAAIGHDLGLSEDAARMRFNRAVPKLAKAVERLRRGEAN